MKKNRGKYPEWVEIHRGPNREIKEIRGKYYLYCIKHEYDSEKKISRKITSAYIGRIRETGLIESNKKRSAVQFLSNIHTVEYGVGFFILQQTYRVNMLKKHFPSNWKIILALAYTRFAYQAPIRRMLSVLQHSYLPIALNFSVHSEKEIRREILKLGANKDLCINYMKEFITSGDYLLIDTTDIAHNSRRITLQNYQDNDDQSKLHLIYIYSSKSKEPIGYRLTIGNFEELKTVYLNVKESPFDSITTIGDFNFYSHYNLEKLTADGLNYILLLDKDYPLLDYSKLIGKDNRFTYLDQQIWYKQINVDKETIYIFLNPQLKAAEENDYLKLLDKKQDNYTYDDFNTKRNSFGTLALITNLSSSAADIYSMYKTKLEISKNFNALGNILNINDPLPPSSTMLDGWMFLNHLALQFYYDITNLLRERKINKISIRDVLYSLKTTTKIKINDNWILSNKTLYDQALHNDLGLKIL